VDLDLKIPVKPTPEEPICLMSYIIASTRVGGGPKERTGFWAAYREALQTNRRTKYRNRRVDLCGSFLEELYQRFPEFRQRPVFFREGQLIQERIAAVLGDSLQSLA
jgi:hypothetical protein